MYKFIYYGQIKYCHCHCHCHHQMAHGLSTLTNPLIKGVSLGIKDVLTTLSLLRHRNEMAHGLSTLTNPSIKGVSLGIPDVVLTTLSLLRHPNQMAHGLSTHTNPLIKGVSLGITTIQEIFIQKHHILLCQWDKYMICIKTQKNISLQYLW